MFKRNCLLRRDTEPTALSQPSIWDLFLKKAGHTPSLMGNEVTKYVTRILIMQRFRKEMPLLELQADSAYASYPVLSIRHVQA
jgi:hypothetical protein